MLGQKVTPLASAGVYVPGGKAVYPSSVLMNIVPAKIAGVDHVVMCTPVSYTHLILILLAQWWQRLRAMEDFE